LFENPLAFLGHGVATRSIIFYRSFGGSCGGGRSAAARTARPRTPRQIAAAVPRSKIFGCFWTVVWQRRRCDGFKRVSTFSDYFEHFRAFAFLNLLRYSVD